ncbi:permease [Verrucomicrobiaceae bacterium N1E253]|uniref:Permease n=1 Tax=Oceaniferula marina TaxID=2748318 RepID=A0A851GR00_9BACT|nr:permease [Oceaniferula marina]NWK57545.1 permease [Oceaniferula marina]
MDFLILFKMLLEAAPYIVAGFLMAGAIHQWVPQDMLMRHLGRGGSAPLCKAVGIGALLPICSCGTIPLGVGLYRCGAAAGTVLSFMTSSPVLSPVVVLIAIKMLGLKLALTLLGSALIGSYLIGGVGNKVLPENKQQATDDGKQYAREQQTQKGGSIRQWLRWSFFDLGAHVSVELVIGLGIATLALMLLPTEFVSTWLGQQQFSALVIVILMSIPVYTCSVPGVPIVHSLLLMGATPGVAVAYMIAGPSTNLGELNAIRKSMGLKTSVYYASALIIVALSAGVITDRWIFPAYEYKAAYVQGKLVVEQCCVPVIFEDSSRFAVDWASVSPLQWISGIILLVVIVIGVVHELREFFVNPCQTCLWREFQKKNRCAAKCHVRRKHDLFKRCKRVLLRLLGMGKKPRVSS